MKDQLGLMFWFRKKNHLGGEGRVGQYEISRKDSDGKA